MTMPRMQLKDIALNRLEFSLNNDFDPDKTVDGVSFNLRTQGDYDKESNLLLIELCVTVPENKKVINFPISIDLNYGGIFEIDEKIDDKLFTQLRDINCPAIIYPYVRELVADITRRSGLPPLLLPIINFVKRGTPKKGKKNEGV